MTFVGLRITEDTNEKTKKTSGKKAKDKENEKEDELPNFKEEDNNK